MVSHPKIHPPGLVSDFQADKNKISIDKTAPIGRNTCPISAFSGFPESPGLSASFTDGQLANQGMGSHPKIHPPGLVGDFQADKKVALTKIAPIGRNTCSILAFSGFPESPGSSATFTNGRLANQGMESHPKIHPPELVSDFQAAALLPQRRSS